MVYINSINKMLRIHTKKNNQGKPIVNLETPSLTKIILHRIISIVWLASSLTELRRNPNHDDVEWGFVPSVKPALGCGSTAARAIDDRAWLVSNVSGRTELALSGSQWKSRLKILQRHHRSRSIDVNLRTWHFCVVRSNSIPQSKKLLCNVLFKKHCA